MLTLCNFVRLHYSGRSQVIAGKTIGVMTLFSLLLLIGRINSIGQAENIIEAHVSISLL